jgi:hypothetical protein
MLLKTGLFFLMLLLFTGLQAQKKLYVQANDGTKSSFPLTEIRKVTFPSRTLIVYNNNGNIHSFPFADIHQARFSEWLSGNNTLDLQEKNEIALYPNPVSEELTVSIISESAQSIEIRILDMKGTTVYTQVGNAIPGANPMKIRLSHLAKGIYICRVIKGKSIATGKFQKN